MMTTSKKTPKETKFCNACQKYFIQNGSLPRVMHKAFDVYVKNEVEKKILNIEEKMLVGIDIETNSNSYKQGYMKCIQRLKKLTRS